MDNDIDWQHISQILTTSEFLKNRRDIEELCTELRDCYETEDGDQLTLINDLCTAITADNDYDCCCCQTLTETPFNFEWQQRLKLYKILFYQYVTLSQLDMHHIINILKANIKKYHFNANINVKDFEKAARFKHLNGSTFESITSDHFANMLIDASIKYPSLSVISKSIWKQIYEQEITKWNSTNNNNNNKHTKRVRFATVMIPDEDIKHEEEPYNGYMLSTTNKNHEQHQQKEGYNKNSDTYAHIDIDQKAVDEEIKMERYEMKEEKYQNESDITSSDSDDSTKDDTEDDVESTFGGKIKRPKVPNSSDYPRYINKCFWTRSDDENLERFIDRTVLKVLHSRRVKNVWNDPKYVEWLYDDKTFRKFVDKIYKEIDGREFITKTLSKLYKHQIAHSINNLQPRKKKKLNTDKEIFNQMQRMEFKEFDTDRNGMIDFNEFVSYFKRKKLKIGKKKLQKMFCDIQTDHGNINGEINRTEFRKWKESLINNSIQIQDKDTMAHTLYKMSNKMAKTMANKGSWTVYYNAKSNTYHFAEGIDNFKIMTQLAQKPRMIRTLHYNEDSVSIEDNFKWAVFITKGKDLKEKLGDDFKRIHPNLKRPKGFWRIYNDDDAGNVSGTRNAPRKIRFPSIESLKALKSRSAEGKARETPSKRDLDLIFLLLYHYYLIVMDEGSVDIHEADDPIKRHLEHHKETYFDDSSLNNRMHNTLRYRSVHDQNQKATWFFDGNKNDNGLKRIERDNKIIFEIKGNKYELKYWNKRGKYQTTALVLTNITNAMRENKNKESCYLRFNTDFDGIEWQWFDNDEDTFKNFDKTLYTQLEASFLGNDERNFNRNEFKYLNNCLLTELKRHLSEQQKDGYIFNVLFSSSSGAHDVISAMSQISFDYTGNFTRKMRRMLDGTDSLLTHFQNSNIYLEEWKEARKLSSTAQQKYFFCFIVAIAAKIKYIDIEMSLQPIMLPGSSNLHLIDDTAQKDVDFMDIDARDVKKEQNDFEFFEGYLIPLDRIWSNPKDTKTKILQKHRSENRIKGRHRYRWMQHSDSRQCFFSREQAQLLRFTECIRKYVLEVEQGDTLNTLWPWYRNSFHSKDGVDDADTYNDLMKKEFFLQSWKLVTSKDGSSILEIFKQHMDTTKCNNDDEGYNEEDDDDPPPIRHKRKFGAYLLLDSSDVRRNLNILKNQLSPLLHDIEHEAIAAYLGDDTTYKIIYKQYVDKYPEDFQKKMDRFVGEYIRGNAKDAKTKLFWQNHIKRVNEKFLNKKKDFEFLDKNDEENFKFEESHKLFNEHFENIEYLDIDRFKLPIFEEFVRFFFVASDENRYKKIHEDNKKYFVGDDKEYYRTFLESWRDTPRWYTYQHDILLLELVLRNGVNGTKIIADLESKKDVQYKIRLKCEDYFDSKKMKHKYDYDRYYQFKMWCKVQFNMWHRLKYVTNIIIKNLFGRGGDISLYQVRIDNPEDIPTFSCKSRIFSDYQKTTHIEFVKSQQLDNLETFDPNLGDDMMHKTNTMTSIDEVISQSVCCCNSKKNYENVQSYDEDLQQDDEASQLQELVQITSNLRKKKKAEYRIRNNDPFLNRDLDIELMETLQSFDLLKYGVPLAIFVIEQLKKQMIPTYWKILGALMNVLPPQLAISALKNEKSLDILRHGHPDRLKTLCLQLVSGASFKPAAALAAAALFDGLAEEDLIQETFWTECGNVFEIMAFEEINKIESNHLLYILLNIPLLSNERQTLIELALDGKRIEFLNNDRINSVIHHLYVNGFLKPGEEIETSDLQYHEMLKQLWHYPFDFYLSARGYYWTSTVLFLLYFILVCMYAYLRPMQEGDLVGPQRSIGAIFWICNGGYVLYEVFEFWEKGCATYFDVDVMGETNILDAALSIFWIFLFILRCYFVFLYPDYDSFDPQHPTAAQQIYIFVFGIQIVLITLRSLTLFSNTENLGVLLKIISKMATQISKFLYVYIISMFGILFGLWFIAVSNLCSYPNPDNNEEYDDICADYSMGHIWWGLKYIFEVFIGTGDLSGIANQSLGIVFMIAATFFGSLILTNLLIALMTTEYEAVQSQAKEEVIFNQTELTFDLTSRSRQMPPPLNIVVYAASLTVHVLNFFTALIHPRYLNIYTFIDFGTFEKFRRFSLWRCSVNWSKKGKVELDKEGQDKIKSNFKYNRKNIMYFYITSKLTKLKSFCIRKYCNKNKRNRNHHNHKLKRTTKKQKTALTETHDIARENWQILHKGCYGHILVQDNGKNKNKNKQLSMHSTAQLEEDPSHITNDANLKAITMSQLMTQFEANGSRFDSADSALLKQLTSTETLFCEFCNRAVLSAPDYLIKELTTPYAALLDLMSALTFIFIPIAWFALLIILAVLSIFDGIGKVFDRDHELSQYKSKDFDREYFPNQFAKNIAD